MGNFVQLPQFTDKCKKTHLFSAYWVTYAGYGDRPMNTDFQHSSIIQSSSGGKDNSDHSCNEYF